MPATFEQISKFLASNEWDASEKWVIKWQFGLLEGFEAELANCIKHADEQNLVRLGLGFPVEVTGYTSWVYGNLGNRLRQAGLNI